MTSAINNQMAEYNANAIVGIENKFDQIINAAKDMINNLNSGFKFF